MTGLFCVIARNSPFQAILAFLVCALYSMLLLRHTPYLSDDADLLALACSFALALTLLTGYVITATKSFLSDPKDKPLLKESMNLLDVFLLVINGIPFVIFIAHVIKNTVKKKCGSKKNQENNDKDKNTTKVVPTMESVKVDDSEELGYDSSKFVPSSFVPPSPVSPPPAK